MKAYIKLTSADELTIDTTVSAISGCFVKEDRQREYRLEWDCVSVYKSAGQDADNAVVFILSIELSDAYINVSNDDCIEEDIPVFDWEAQKNIIDNITNMHIAVRVDEDIFGQQCSAEITFGDDRSQKDSRDLVRIPTVPAVNLWGGEENDWNDDEDDCDDWDD